MMRRLAELKILIAAERKKAWALGVLICLMAIVGARNLMPWLSPSGAQARTSAGGVHTGADTDASVLASGPVMARGALVRVARPKSVSRDLFRFDPLYFPSPTETAPPDPDGQKFAEPAVEETPPKVAESPEARARRVRTESERLRVRSVMFGTTPMAVIEVPDGKGHTTRLVRPGDHVLGFLVHEIGEGVVTLTKDGERVELTPDR